MDRPDPADVVLAHLDAREMGETGDEVLHRDVVMRRDPGGPAGGTLRGRERVRRHLLAMKEVSGGVRPHALSLASVGNHVVARLRDEPFRLGQINEYSVVYGVADGLIDEITFFRHEDEAIAHAAGELYPRLGWAEVSETLASWDGRQIILVPIFDPGACIRPFHGRLTVTRTARDLQLAVPSEPPIPSLPNPDGVTVRLHERDLQTATWVRGRHGTGLALEHGAIRLDIFAD